MTLAELRSYLTGMLKLANQYDVEANAESIAAKMWKHFTPEALSRWTTSGVLEHIAECLAPVDVETEDAEEQE